jgi:hypothetical protein
VQNRQKGLIQILSYAIAETINKTLKIIKTLKINKTLRNSTPAATGPKAKTDTYSFK